MYLLNYMYMRKVIDMERPIGYWLKRLDRLMEAAFDRTLTGERLARRHWQALNTLHTSPQTPEGLSEAMRPFWGPGAITLDDVTGELTHRGWVTRDDAGRYALTPAGQAGHAAVQEKAQEIRFTVLAGLTEDDYNQTVAALKLMADNLERAAAGGSGD
jgi:hypothetical protein